MALADDLKAEQERVKLYAKLGFEAKVGNDRLPTMARILELAWRGLELANEVEQERKAETWIPSRWAAFYLGAFVVLVLQHWFG